jgi:hypothetical protein
MVTCWVLETQSVSPVDGARATSVDELSACSAGEADAEGTVEGVVRWFTAGWITLEEDVPLLVPLAVTAALAGVAGATRFENVAGAAAGAVVAVTAGGDTACSVAVPGPAVWVDAASSAAWWSAAGTG